MKFIFFGETISQSVKEYSIPVSSEILAKNDVSNKIIVLALFLFLYNKNVHNIRTKEKVTIARQKIFSGCLW